MAQILSILKEMSHFPGHKKRAADGNRTRDLRTTNATLYRLSHSSIVDFERFALSQSPLFIIANT